MKFDPKIQNLDIECPVFWQSNSFLCKMIVDLKNISFMEKFIFRKLVEESQILPILGKITVYLGKRKKACILKLSVTRNHEFYTVF